MDVDMALSDAFLRAPDVKGLASRDSPPPYWKNVSPHALRNGWPGLILRILRALCIVTAAWLLLWAGSEYIRKARVPSKDPEIVKCVNITHGTANGLPAATATFRLPVDAEVLYLLSRGPYSAGQLDVVTSFTQDRDVVVEVNTTHDGAETIAGARVCRLTRGPGQHGLGLLTPVSEYSNTPVAQLKWQVRVSIPHRARVNTFETDTPGFATNVDVVTINFDTLALRTSDAPVTVNRLDRYDRVRRTSIHTTNAPIQAYLSGDEVVLSTTHGEISGRYWLRRSFVAETSHAPIKAGVNLFNRDSALPSTARLRTEDGEIVCALDTSGYCLKPGMCPSAAFDVIMETTNAPLVLNAPDLEMGSVLHLGARMSNASAHVSLGRGQFEGAFRARAPGAAVQLDWVRDPSGANRVREVESEWKDARSAVNGTVRWDKRLPSDWLYQPVTGLVEVYTSDAPLKLTL